jgi:hypothetical protein
MDKLLMSPVWCKTLPEDAHEGAPTSRLLLDHPLSGVGPA